MKKFVVFVLLVLMITGCGKKTSGDVKENFITKIEKKNSYLMKGTMNITSNEDVFSYNVTAAKDKENYRVNLVNQINNHEQVILRNDDGVYVVTPSLNKSFKFQSDWPYSNSQIYLLKSLVNDIKNTKDIKFEEYKSGYKIVTTVNYPNNSKLVEQVIELNKKLDIKKVKVYDDNQAVMF